MTKKGIFIASFLLIFALCGCDSGWQRYKNKEYQFSILMPRLWQMVEDSYGTVLSVKAPFENKDDHFQENINILVTELSTAMELSTFFELNKDELMSRLGGISNILEGDIYAGFLAGKWLSFEGKMNNMTLKIMVAMWLKDKRIYTITCTAEAEKFLTYQTLFTKVMKSLRVK